MTVLRPAIGCESVSFFALALSQGFLHVAQSNINATTRSWGECWRWAARRSWSMTVSSLATFRQCFFAKCLDLEHLCTLFAATRLPTTLAPIVSGEWFWMVLIRGTLCFLCLYRRMVTKVADQDIVIRWYSTQSGAQTNQVLLRCWVVHMVPLTVQVVAISSLLKKCPTSDKLCLADKRAFEFNRSLRHFPRFYKRHSSEFRFAQRFCSVIHQPCVQAGLSFPNAVSCDFPNKSQPHALLAMSWWCTLRELLRSATEVQFAILRGGMFSTPHVLHCHKTLFSRMSSNVGTSCLSVANLSSAGLTPGSLHRSARSLSTIQVKPVHL